jgi:hypothetical protein
MWPGSRPMSGVTLTISFITLLLAIVLPTLTILLYDNKGLARVLFVVVMVVGCSVVLVRWRRNL